MDADKDVAFPEKDLVHTVKVSSDSQDKSSPNEEFMDTLPKDYIFESQANEFPANLIEALEMVPQLAPIMDVGLQSSLTADASQIGTDKIIALETNIDIVGSDNDNQISSSRVDVRAEVTIERSNQQDSRILLDKSGSDIEEEKEHISAIDSIVAGEVNYNDFNGGPTELTQYVSEPAKLSFINNTNNLDIKTAQEESHTKAHTNDESTQHAIATNDSRSKSKQNLFSNLDQQISKDLNDLSSPEYPRATIRMHSVISDTEPKENEINDVSDTSEICIQDKQNEAHAETQCVSKTEIECSLVTEKPSQEVSEKNNIPVLNKQDGEEAISQKSLNLAEDNPFISKVFNSVVQSSANDINEESLTIEAPNHEKSEVLHSVSKVNSNAAIVAPLVSHFFETNQTIIHEIQLPKEKETEENPNTELHENLNQLIDSSSVSGNTYKPAEGCHSKFTSEAQVYDTVNNTNDASSSYLRSPTGNVDITNTNVESTLELANEEHTIRLSGIQRKVDLLETEFLNNERTISAKKQFEFEFVESLGAQQKTSQLNVMTTDSMSELEKKEGNDIFAAQPPTGRRLSHITRSRPKPRRKSDKFENIVSTGSVNASRNVDDGNYLIINEGMIVDPVQIDEVNGNVFSKSITVENIEAPVLNLGQKDEESRPIFDLADVPLRTEILIDEYLIKIDCHTDANKELDKEKSDTLLSAGSEIIPSDISDTEENYSEAELSLDKLKTSNKSLHNIDEYNKMKEQFPNPMKESEDASVMSLKKELLSFSSLHNIGVEVRFNRVSFQEITSEIYIEQRETEEEESVPEAQIHDEYLHPVIRIPPTSRIPRLFFPIGQNIAPKIIDCNGSLIPMSVSRRERMKEQKRRMTPMSNTANKKELKRREIYQISTANKEARDVPMNLLLTKDGLFFQSTIKINFSIGTFEISK